jgi:hypothetical protein
MLALLREFRRGPADHTATRRIEALSKATEACGGMIDATGGPAVRIDGETAFVKLKDREGRSKLATVKGSQVTCPISLSLVFSTHGKLAFTGPEGALATGQVTAVPPILHPRHLNQLSE